MSPPPPGQAECWRQPRGSVQHEAAVATALFWQRNAEVAAKYFAEPACSAPVMA